MPQIAQPQRLPCTAVPRAARSRRRSLTKDRHAAEPSRSVARAQHLGASAKRLSQVVLATLLVAGLPVAMVFWLRVSGTISSAPVGLVLGTALSLGGSYLGRVAWERWPRSEDLLFSELMIWGYLHRRRSERRLASARAMLGPMSGPHRRSADGLSTREQAKLLERLVAGMETRDRYLHGHSRRVARYAWMIARRMGLPRAEVARIRTAAAIHDVGKIKTPKAILHKAGSLTAGEYDVIKRHPRDGARTTAALQDPALTSMVRHHHERLDGTGYPTGLPGAAIPLGARIIAVADTFDAITSVRPYRAASPHKTAIDILKSEAGTKLDPDVVRAFCSHYAGRRPLALWSSIAGLAGRGSAWLGGGVASVASVAKVVAVAAVVGSAAATTSTVARPVASPDPAKTRSASAAWPQPRRVQSTSATGSVLASPAATSRNRHVDRVPRAVGVTPSGRHGSPTPLQTNSSGIDAVRTQTSQAGNGSAQGTQPVKGEPPVKSEELPVKHGEPPVKVEPPVKIEPPAKKEPTVTIEPPVKIELPVKREPTIKVEPPVKIEPPLKQEPTVKVELPLKIELPVKIKVGG